MAGRLAPVREACRPTRRSRLAKFWAHDGGHRVLHAAHHLHGGMGVDRDYPLHRYNFNITQWGVLMGTGTPTLARLGKVLAG